MLVYGDRREAADTRQCARDIKRDIEALGRMEPGITRHSKLAGVLIDAGRLLQGIADAAFEQAGVDRRSTDQLNAWLLELGRALCRSWGSGFRELVQLPNLETGDDWPEIVELREPEGYAFYAVYPEAYVEAARRLRLSGKPRVIGIRSIGTSLAAVVAAALDAGPPATVRPFGDPFARRIAIDSELERELLEGEPHFVIVDEGPGQSGSSFGAVADWLQKRGVPLERIAVLASHPGSPGPAATEERRRWWGIVQRQAGDFGENWPMILERWCCASIGKLDEPPRDISGGGWRALHYAREEEWPPTVPAWERRKILVSVGGERFLLKFAGLGRISEEKLAIARALHSEGFVSEPFALVHGFLVERWCDDASPLRENDKPVAEIAHYIASRAKLLPASSGDGASVEDLLRLGRRNVSLEFGDELASALEDWERRAPDLERLIVRVRTDNKLDRYEWLRTARGTLIKADALDHHRAHDLIGCQDAAWDAAGAIAEFDLDQSESSELVRQLRLRGVLVEPQLLEFYRIAYLAFRLGQCRMGTAMVSDRRERQRITRRGDRYAAELQDLLESSSASNRLESSLG